MLIMVLWIMILFSLEEILYQEELDVTNQNEPFE